MALQAYHGVLDLAVLHEVLLQLLVIDVALKVSQGKHEGTAYRNVTAEVLAGPCQHSQRQVRLSDVAGTAHVGTACVRTHAQDPETADGYPTYGPADKDLLRALSCPSLVAGHCGPGVYLPTVYVVLAVEHVLCASWVRKPNYALFPLVPALYDGTLLDLAPRKGKRNESGVRLRKPPTHACLLIKLLMTTIYWMV